MVSFTDFCMSDGVPIYKQILLYIKRNVVAERVANGDELPSRRELSALLGVNPNTVQKAYRILEQEQLIVSRSGAKSLMVLDEQKVKSIRRQLLDEEAIASVRALNQMGITLDEAKRLIEKNWDREDDYEM